MKLSEILKKHSFKFTKKLGQNFLYDENLLGEIVNLSGVDQNTCVVEIGCGAGTLTKELSKRAKFVYGYEIDKTLAPVLGETLSGVGNCEITFKDIMKEDVSALEKRIGEHYKIVANLPYYITSPLIMKFIENSVLCDAIVIMVQEEVAKRILAAPGTADYGAITAGINLVADSERLINVTREKFYPAPEVDSAVVKITFNRDKFTVKDKKLYRVAVRTAFSSRRKTLANNLVLGLKISRDQAENILSSAKIPLMSRGETLSAEDFVRLSDCMYEQKVGL